MNLDGLKRLLIEKLKKSKMIQMKDSITIKLKKKEEKNYEEQKDVQNQ